MTVWSMQISQKCNKLGRRGRIGILPLRRFHKAALFDGKGDPMKHERIRRMTATVLILAGILALICYALTPIPVLTLDGRSAEPAPAGGYAQLSVLQ